jgi:hypothetical protein
LSPSKNKKRKEDIYLLSQSFCCLTLPLSFNQTLIV